MTKESFEINRMPLVYTRNGRRNFEQSSTRPAQVLKDNRISRKGGNHA
jgi:hypothetical protein